MKLPSTLQMENLKKIDNIGDAFEALPAEAVYI